MEIRKNAKIIFIHTKAVENIVLFYATAIFPAIFLCI
jgi:hypothetical protein